MLARRQFVTSTLAAGVALASQKATAQPAKRTIVDAQVHLWKAEEEWEGCPSMTFTSLCQLGSRRRWLITKRSIGRPI